VNKDFTFNATPLNSKAGGKDIKEAKVDRLIELSYKTMAESPEAAMACEGGRG